MNLVKIVFGAAIYTNYSQKGKEMYARNIMIHEANYVFNLIFSMTEQ